MILKKSIIAALSTLSLCGAAFAQTQEGLVNVNVADNVVQVPIGVAAQVCNIDANVLAEQFVGKEESACTITQEVAAENNIGSEPGNGTGGGDAEQNGVVNVNVEDNVVQVPIGVAAQVCNIDANVLAEQFVGKEESACTITQDVAAENNIGSEPGNGTGGGDAEQNGVVNVNVEDNVVQVPIGVAAQVCNIDANVLAEQFVGKEESACTITQDVAAENNIGQ